MTLASDSELQRCQVLSDDKKRALYDQYGEAGVKSAVGGGSSAYTVFNMIIFLLVSFVCKIGSHTLERVIKLACQENKTLLYRCSNCTCCLQFGKNLN